MILKLNPVPHAISIIFESGVSSKDLIAIFLYREFTVAQLNNESKYQNARLSEYSSNKSLTFLLSNDI
jgi:hypothetical protein